MADMRKQVVDCDPEVFKNKFNRSPHEIQHSLSAHPLFALPAIAELAQRVASRERPHHRKGDIYIEESKAALASGFDVQAQTRMRASELVARIEQGQTWVILKHIEREPGYREIFEDCISDIVLLAGKHILRQVKWFDATLFVTSPNRITDYHIDRECSWLLQIHGNKDIHFFDRDDKDILPDVELEQYWTGNNLASPYKPQYESRAMIYNLRPGVGVHNPVNSPHWLQNRDNVSVSLNINFQFHEGSWENLFRANHYLRRIGLTPASPGKNMFADNVKRNTYTAIQDLQRLLKRQPRVSSNEARQHYHQIVQMLASR